MKKIHTEEFYAPATETLLDALKYDKLLDAIMKLLGRMDLSAEVMGSFDIPMLKTVARSLVYQAYDQTYARGYEDCLRDHVYKNNSTEKEVSTTTNAPKRKLNS